MVEFDAIQCFIGFDWASDHHDVVVVDRAGRIVEEFRFDDTAEGWALFQERRAQWGVAAAAVETSFGSFVSRLLDAGVIVYPVQPKAAQRYRDRKAPSGAKSDRADAWSLADSLRTDGHAWRPLPPEDPLVCELRLLARDEVEFIELRTALVHRLRQALREFFPAVLQAFDDVGKSFVWKFLEQFPTPAALGATSIDEQRAFLRAHRLRQVERRLTLFAQADQFQGTPAVVAAKSLLAQTLVGQLLLLEQQLATYRAKIEQRFAQHPHHDLFGSLPGAGPKIAPRLLGEIGDNPERFSDAQGLECLAGVAPVSFQSGKRHVVRLRRACNKNLRAAVHHLANLSRQSCAWAQEYYQAKRQQGMQHACALRCLGRRWLKILWAMIQKRTPYNEALHLDNRNQRHLPRPTPALCITRS